MTIQDVYIPFHRASLGAEEIQAVTDVLASGWLTTGTVAHRFEKEFADYIGCKHALAVNSGTAALQLALDAIGLRPGDEVLVPTYTFTATAEIVTHFGARPVLCDSVQGGFNIDPEDVEKRITERTKAIVPVHVAGQPCDLDALYSIAGRHSVHVVEDAAHALPTFYKGQKVGATAELSAFSFYATKTITTGEGGMLTTNDDDYAERAAMMRLHGIGKGGWNRYSPTGSWYYQVLEAGYKLNLCDVLASLGLAQLHKCDSFWKQRLAISNLYRELLSSVEELEMPPSVELPNQHSWHLFIIRIRPEALTSTRDEIIQDLKRIGIGTSVHYIPLHRHPFYIRSYGYAAHDFPRAENAYSRCISLPIYPDLDQEHVHRIASSLTQIVHKHRKTLGCAV
jgi:dTDP-4-amino-4,6-dideoxygalactose transaminase